ncbi:hypothetical protein LCGC14_3087780 [marine sediment metagenome]|uniref:Uncharacterized protein n=1 Tax=marine sediment metagenome TaxID=412755 RepID=A0A0F8X022_9ZZZZ
MSEKKKESIENIILDFLRERLINTIYKCYKKIPKIPNEQIYYECLETIWNSDNTFIKKRVRLLESYGYTPNNIFPIKVVPPSHKLVKLPMEILSLEDLRYKFETFEDVNIIDKKISELIQWENIIHKRDYKQAKKLLKVEEKTKDMKEVIRKFGKDFTLEKGLEFYLKKLGLKSEKIIEKIEFI